KIGSHCRLDPNVTIYPGTTLGDRVIVQAGAVLGSAGFGYVRDSQTGRYEQFPQVGRLVIEDDVEIGANSPSTAARLTKPASAAAQRSTTSSTSVTTSRSARTWSSPRKPAFP